MKPTLTVPCINEVEHGERREEEEKKITSTQNEIENKIRKWKNKKKKLKSWTIN